MIENSGFSATTVRPNLSSCRAMLSIAVVSAVLGLAGCAYDPETQEPEIKAEAAIEAGARLAEIAKEDQAKEKKTPPPQKESGSGGGGGGGGSH